MIFLPPRWVLFDVVGNPIQRFVVANNIIPVIALPQFAFELFPSQLFDTTDVFVGRHRFEPIDNFTDGWVVFFVVGAVLGLVIWL